ncbi:MAG: hypothetical protein AAF639_01185 [Chloroflexota bacterium]
MDTRSMLQYSKNQNLELIRQELLAGLDNPDDAIEDAIINRNLRHHDKRRNIRFSWYSASLGILLILLLGGSLVLLRPSDGTTVIGRPENDEHILTLEAPPTNEANLRATITPMAQSTVDVAATQTVEAAHTRMAKEK